MMNTLKSLSSLIFFLLLSGCSAVTLLSDAIKERNPLAAGGASLRVTVDVYKGGLGSSGLAQKRARLAGLIGTVESILPIFQQKVVYERSAQRSIQWHCAVYFTGGEADATSRPVEKGTDIVADNFVRSGAGGDNLAADGEYVPAVASEEETRRKCSALWGLQKSYRTLVSKFVREEVDTPEEPTTTDAPAQTGKSEPKASLQRKSNSALSRAVLGFAGNSNKQAQEESDEVLLTFSNRAASLATLYARTALEYSNNGLMKKDSIRRLVAVANSLRHVSDQIDVAVQYGSAGSRGIPLSAHLRATSTENFTDLYTWAGLAEVKSLSLSPIQTDRDAAKAFKMLDERNYWENINQAYASGQGDFSVALIKDDIGNWDIKNFANDPSDLRKAQQKFAVDMIGMLAEGTLPINSGISRAQKLVDFARGQSTVTADTTLGTGGLTEALERTRRSDMLVLHQVLVDASAAWEGIATLAKSADDCRDEVIRTEGKQGAIVIAATQKRAGAEAKLKTEIERLEALADAGRTITSDIGSGENAKMSVLLTEVGIAKTQTDEATSAIEIARTDCRSKTVAYTTAARARESAFSRFFDMTALQVAQSHHVLDAVESQNDQPEEVVQPTD